MDFKVEEISGIGEYLEEKIVKNEKIVGRKLLLSNEKCFLIENFGGGEGDVRTIEVRTDGNLAKLLCEKYESVMSSRYFGRGGVEIVLSGQIPKDELYDMTRLSYNLSK